MKVGFWTTYLAMKMHINKNALRFEKPLIALLGG